MLLNHISSMYVQVERRSPQHYYRPRHNPDGPKMRASVRMTRYLESWGAAKPFANLHHRDSMTNENGKISTSVRISYSISSYYFIIYVMNSTFVGANLFCTLSCFILRMSQWGSIISEEDQKGKLAFHQTNIAP